MGTLIAFQLGARDAAFLECEFQPDFKAEDLVNLDRHQIYLKLAIDGMTSRPFSARTLPPLEIFGHKSNKDNIIKTSRQRYGTRREVVEKKIEKWLG